MLIAYELPCLQIYSLVITEHRANFVLMYNQVDDRKRSRQKAIKDQQVLKQTYSAFNSQLLEI
jgi:hypothetical protein